MTDKLTQSTLRVLFGAREDDYVEAEYFGAIGYGQETAYHTARQLGLTKIKSSDVVSQIEEQIKAKHGTEWLKADLDAEAAALAHTLALQVGISDPFDPFVLDNRLFNTIIRSGTTPSWWTLGGAPMSGLLDESADLAIANYIARNAPQVGDDLSSFDTQGQEWLNNSSIKPLIEQAQPGSNADRQLVAQVKNLYNQFMAIYSSSYLLNFPSPARKIYQG